MTPFFFDAAREKMVRRQLHQRGIRSPRVLAAMGHVPRERFVPASERGEAYADRALPIDCSQTISQPYIVGLMTEALEFAGTESVLEIGTGSGYQTAVLAELANRVVSIERHAELSAQAARALAELGYGNVQLIVGDGTLGWPPAAPYDRILVAAAAGTVPPALFEQLREGGILVIPVGDVESQVLVSIRKEQGQPQMSRLTGCRFVPLVGSAEAHAEDQPRANGQENSPK
jgi:protein-L-isoaspartate(D-aspartate) O-methyltransferase